MIARRAINRIHDDIVHLVLDTSTIIDWHKHCCRLVEQAFERERALGREPDPRSMAGVEAKRAWLRGEITEFGGLYDAKCGAKSAWLSTPMGPARLVARMAYHATETSALIAWQEIISLQ